MSPHRILSLLASILLSASSFAEVADAPLPNGVKAVWDIEKAFHEKTPTRERVCLNGLWRWQPATDATEVPAGKWGFFKVPGCWPGASDYMQKDSQTLYPHPAWKDTKIRGVSAAWYQRELTVPTNWDGQRIVLRADYLNSFATVFIDEKKAGEMRFPGGELDVTAFCKPGEKRVLSMYVFALPLKGVMLSYGDSAAAKEVKGTVERRGLCGDVWLEATPAAGRISDVRVATSVRRGEISISVTLHKNAADPSSAMRVQISENGRVVKEFSSPAFGFPARDMLDPNNYTLTEKWKPEKLWDLHTPQNQYELSVSVVDSKGKTIDAAYPVRFGFREFWIDGRDFYLNGTRLFLSAVPIDNTAISAAASTYDAAKESLLRLKSIGINFVYTHNYGCEPGTHLSFVDLLRAADDVGMLVAFSQPHFGQYDWKKPNADETNGYKTHAEFYVREAQNHPSIVFYVMSHNATGYNDDMNPEMIDGLSDPRPEGWAKNNVKLALRAEAIVTKLDPSRIVYHHASGDLGPMWNANFYPNMVPPQELDDWFEHWATKGIKPAFTCEYGAPITWDWSNYRGWFKGKRTFGSADVQWEFVFAEWNAQFLGDKAFNLCDAEKADLRWENKQFKAGKTWHRWDYPFELGSREFGDRQTVMAKYITENWRAFRTWGLSGNSPWEMSVFWKLNPKADRSRKELAVDWENLQRPGYSPDFIADQFENMNSSYEQKDWIPLPTGQAVLRNNQPLLAYIAGKPDACTSKDHNFRPGEKIAKQLIVINNSRERVSCNYFWSLMGIQNAPVFRGTIEVPPGDQKRIPIELTAPDSAHEFGITATFQFPNEIQSDSMTLHVLAASEKIKPLEKIALFDPKGETKKMLNAIGIPTTPVEANADLAPFDVLVIGKSALTVDGPGPNLARVRDGLRVIVFEQSSQVLEQRFGFRVEEYGLRNVFKRIPDHPFLAGLDLENLRDWRGEATLLPPHLKMESDNTKFNGASTVKWCGIDVTRLWRCGCRGSVASVLIEKPARGDFFPILDGGFSLQFSPLMEYREGKGTILFCQMDVTGRTESDPAAERLVANIFSTVTQHASGGKLVYAGEPAGKTFFEKAGYAVADFDGNLKNDQVLVVAPGAGEKLAVSRARIDAFIKDKGRVLLLGLDAKNADAFLPFKVSMKKAEHIATTFEAPPRDSPFAGIGPADVHNRDVREMPLVQRGADIFGDGVLANVKDTNVVFCQLVPWPLDYSKQFNLKRTFRRTSFLVARLLANMGAPSPTPLIERFSSPVEKDKSEKRWLDGLYLDVPEELDDPYRFFRW